MRTTKLLAVLASAALLLGVAGCKSDNGSTTASSTQPPAATSGGATTPKGTTAGSTPKGTTPKSSSGTTPKTPKGSTPTTSGGPKGTVNLPNVLGKNVQFPTSATATSNYGANPGDDWNASQATGPLDTPVCGDFGTAWASANASTVDTITLKYANAVVPTGVIVVQSDNPGRVTAVEVSGPNNASEKVYTGDATQATECPGLLTVDTGSIKFPVDTVAVTVDQTTAGGWAEIDTVALVS